MKVQFSLRCCRSSFLPFDHSNCNSRYCSLTSTPIKTLLSMCYPKDPNLTWHVGTIQEICQDELGRELAQRYVSELQALQQSKKAGLITILQGNSNTFSPTLVLLSAMSSIHPLAHNVEWAITDIFWHMVKLIMMPGVHKLSSCFATPHCMKPSKLQEYFTQPCCWHF